VFACLSFVKSSFSIERRSGWWRRGGMMAAVKKSYDLFVDVPGTTSRDTVLSATEFAARSVGLYVSHIGGYSRTKYPTAIHWHFKRDKRETGLIDATFWDVRSLFWLMVRYREPAWVHDTAPILSHALTRELQSYVNSEWIGRRRNPWH
jgi:hypothetical protein